MKKTKKFNIVLFATWNPSTKREHKSSKIKEANKLNKYEKFKFLFY